MFIQDDRYLWVVFSSGVDSGKFTVAPNSNSYASKLMLVKLDSNDGSTSQYT